MPFTWIVDTIRDLFSGDLGNSDVLWGLGFAVGLSALAFWWGTSVFRNETA